MENVNNFFSLIVETVETPVKDWEKNMDSCKNTAFSVPCVFVL